MMADQFSLPKATLLADIMHVFKKRGIAHAPVSVYADVLEAIKHVHRSGLMHNTIAANPEVRRLSWRRARPLPENPIGRVF